MTLHSFLNSLALPYLARVNARFDLNFIGIVSEEDRGGRCQDLSNERIGSLYSITRSFRIAMHIEIPYCDT